MGGHGEKEHDTIRDTERKGENRDTQEDQAVSGFIKAEHRLKKKKKKETKKKQTKKKHTSLALEKTH